MPEIASSLPEHDRILRPASSTIERIGFFCSRNWAPLVVILVVLCTVAAGVSLALYSETGRLSLPVLVATFLISSAVFAIVTFPWRPFSPARRWMIRAALSTASDDERVALLSELRQRHGHASEDHPLTTLDLCNIFDDVRARFGEKALRKQARLADAKRQQGDVLQGTLHESRDFCSQRQRRC